MQLSAAIDRLSIQQLGTGIMALLATAEQQVAHGKHMAFALT